jgi:hypothetical protein
MCDLRGGHELVVPVAQQSPHGCGEENTECK